MAKQWVQHISGQGEKWKVQKDDDRLTWCVHKDEDLQCGFFYLPKSEYRLCDPPEVWKDVTEECEVPGGSRQCTITRKGLAFNTEHGYRFRKVQLETRHKCGQTLASIVWAFIVEQKVTE